MARLLIYDAYENKVYTYANLNENDPMPYSTLTTLRLREFRGKSASPTLWTTIAAMEAWNLTRRKYGRGIPVGYAFRRIWEGGHGTRSQHYAGVAFDVGQSLDQRQRTAIYNGTMDLSVFYTGDQQLDQTVIDQDCVSSFYILWKFRICNAGNFIISFDVSCCQCIFLTCY